MSKFKVGDIVQVDGDQAVYKVTRIDVEEGHNCCTGVLIGSVLGGFNYVNESHVRNYVEPESKIRIGDWVRYRDEGWDRRQYKVTRKTQTWSENPNENTIVFEMECKKGQAIIFEMEGDHEGYIDVAYHDEIVLFDPQEAGDGK